MHASNFMSVSYRMDSAPRADFIFFAMFIVVLCAFISSIQPRKLKSRETFENASEQSLIISSRVEYIRQGLVNFFAQRKNVVDVPETVFMDFVKLTTFIWPNYIDLCCQTTQKITDSGTTDVNCDCGNILIDTSSCTDNTLLFMNERKTATITSNLGSVDSKNCMLTLLGNNYTISKRSMKLKITGIEHVGNFTKQRYRLYLEGNLAAFILSRPLFISFNTEGFYRIIYEDMRTRNNETEIYEDHSVRNAFAYFDSTKGSQYRVLVEKINNIDLPQSGLKMVVDTDGTLINMKAPLTVPTTIYYMNYVNEITTASMMSYTATFYIDSFMYGDAFLNRTNINIITSANDSRFVSTVTFRQNIDMSMTLMLDTESYDLPAEFVYYGNANQYDKFHIIITVSYDILNVVCFGVVKNSRKNVAHYARYHIPKVFKMDKTQLINTLQNSKMQDGRSLFMSNEVSDVMNVTAIPNYALLAYKLGYVFDVY
jgi:hypothetical protein